MSESESSASPPEPEQPQSSGGSRRNESARSAGPDSPAGAPPGGSSPGGPESPNRSLMVVLSYLWILALIPLLVEEDDPEVQWHARHGLVLTAAEIVFWLAVFAINSVSGCLGCLLMPLYAVGWLGVLVLHIACMVKGVNGERLIVPGLSQYADRF